MNSVSVLRLLKDLGNDARMNKLSATRRGLYAFSLAVLACFASNALCAATYYVAPTGNDTTGTGSAAAPYRTIGRGIAALASGDTLVLKPGTYVGKSNFINTRLTPIASGTAATPTTIRAESPFSVRIKNGSVLNYYDNLLLLDSGTNYVDVDGLILDHENSVDSSFTAEINGNFNRLTRTIVKRSGETDQYGGWFYVGGNDNLLEDTAGVGSARYGYAMGGPTASTQRNILRRAVGRVDYSVSTQPKATFNVYGNDDGNHNVRDNLLQNLIAIDGRKGSNTSEATYGGFYFPKEPQNTIVQGSLVLNVEAEYSGYFIRELQARGVRLIDSVAWGGYGTSGIAGFRANASTFGEFIVDHVTVGGYAFGYYNQDSAPIRELRNSVFISNGARTGSNDYGWTSATNNAFSPGTQAIGANSIAVTNSVLKYIVRPEVGSALANGGVGGTYVGADLTKRYGASGSRYGEIGYDSKTSLPLWPWPYEDVVKSVFAEANPAPLAATPNANNPKRGFAQDGNDSFGKPLTLTRYVWQYLGNEIPADIYGCGSYVAGASCNLDVNADASFDSNDAVMILRRILGFGPTSVVAGVLQTNCATRTTSLDVASFIDSQVSPQAPSNNRAYDIDGDGRVLATTDGLMLLRAAIGAPGSQIVANATASDAPRRTWNDIRPILNSGCGLTLAP
jgi:hypothetical protein